jgi:hypothetical protein
MNETLEIEIIGKYMWTIITYNIHVQSVPITTEIGGVLDTTLCDKVC